jgi:ATP-dependent RNA helicase DeaD
MSAFSDLGLSPDLLSQLESMDFRVPTEIQERAIPQLLETPRDFLGVAQTGTGKTAAFGLPLLDMLDPDIASTQALILAPTRELGQQIAGHIQDFARKMPTIRVEVVYGGAAISNQIRALRRPVQIVVATPGRLLDLMRRRAVSLDNVKYLILDEADEMLNMGFKEELDAIIEQMPESKVTWLFSATMPPDIRRIVAKTMTDPIEVTVSPKTRINENIEHQVAIVKASDRTEALCRFIDHDPDLYGVAFCRTKSGTQQVAMELSGKGYQVEAIHGDLSQQQRNQVMQRFKSGHINVLIATDVAARGIDVSNLTHVIHYDLPSTLDYYTHRSGRTARAGRTGISLALLSKGQIRRMKQFEHQLGIDVKQVPVPTASEVTGRHVEHWANRLAEYDAGDVVTDEVLAEASKILDKVSHQELIRKLVTIELRKLGYDQSSRDLNEPERRERRDRREREPRKPGRGSSEFNRGGEREAPRKRDDARKPRAPWQMEEPRPAAPRKDKDTRKPRPERKTETRAPEERPAPAREEARKPRPERKTEDRAPERRPAPAWEDARDRDDTRKPRPSRDRDDRGPMRKPGGRYTSFFINIGTVDGVSKPDLLSYVCRHTKLPRDQFGNVLVHEKHSFFEVAAESASAVSPAFSGIKIKGRALRVNSERPDKDAGPREKKKRAPRETKGPREKKPRSQRSPRTKRVAGVRKKTRAPKSRP